MKHVYLIGFFLSWVAITGMLFASIQARFPGQSSRNLRQDLGVATMIGGLGGFIWPIALPAVFLITGFAQDGWSVMIKEKQP
jgi:nitrate/nitrite transporter NarK